MPVAYPPISRLSAIGDRRTAAMVAADGTVVWCCLPDYNSSPTFGSLLDFTRGGHWQVGPKRSDFGKQFYRDSSCVLVTQWSEGGNTLEVTDFMPWPQNQRLAMLTAHRTIIRRVRATAGTVDCAMALSPRRDFESLPNAAGTEHTVEWPLGDETLRLWSSAPVTPDASGVHWQQVLNGGEELWLVLDSGGDAIQWTQEKAQDALDETLAYWREWNDKLTFTAGRRSNVLRSAKLVHLLSYAPSGSLVAAPTTSLPERIGGQSNYDYRHAWLRDASLSLASLSVLGDLESPVHYMDWLTKLDSTVDAPLQPLYQIDGNPRVPEQSRPDIFGYRGSQPVLFGNDAYRQYQPDSFGYFAECALIYLKQEGRWKDEYWQLLQKLANFIADQWQRPSHGIWELPQVRHYVSSKVMSWVTLDRAVKVAEHLELDFDTSQWQSEMRKIHQDVMEHGWSEEQQCFLEHYDGPQLDASVLLISVMDFLPPDHPRMISTLHRLDEKLGINGLIYRFDPQETIAPEHPLLGEFEGAFLPTIFFMATAYAKAGLTHQAEYILETIETVVGDTGLIPEEIDARNLDLLGNTPLVFSLVEYIRAVMELDKAKPVQKLALMAGMLKRKVM